MQLDQKQIIGIRMANKRQIEHEFDKYDMDFLVDQYQLLLQIYSDEGQLSRERLLKMKKIFGIFDFDHQGGIDREEFKALVQKCWPQLGYQKKPSEEEIQRLFEQMDTNSGGEVTFDEFSRFMLAVLRKTYITPLKNYLQAEGLRLE